LDQVPVMPALSEADHRALSLMHAVRPAWRGVALARDVMDFPAETILHAGPPIEAARLPRPILNSAVMAALLQGWAENARQAEQMILAGAIRLAAAQDHRAMVPLAAVLSPDMAVQTVVDLADPARRAFAPLNGGPVRAQRLGLAGPDVLAHLRWINGNLAATLSIIADRDVPLLPIADEALTLGDDCHGRTAAGTRLTIAAIAPRLGTDTPERRFLDAAPGFFLNLWMAACKCIAMAAEVPGSSVITALGGNGAEVGLQLAGLPGRWFTAPATPPEGALIEGAEAGDRLGAVGDSALVDALGFGAMLAPPAELPREQLLPAKHAAFALGGARVGLPAAGLAGLGEAPRIALGILDRAGRRGRIGGGIHTPPATLFSEACTKLTRSSSTPRD